jgi:outer membrane protein TolC
VLLTLARSDARNGRHLLALLVGVSSVDGPLSEDFVAPANRDGLEAFERRAIESRQDLRAAQAAIAAAEQGVKAAIGQYYPSVSLNVGGFLYREFYGDSSKWNAILAANLPVFSAGIIRADVRNAWSQLRQTALNESYVRRQVLYDVRSSYENLVTADQRIKDLQDQVAASNEAYQQARNAFQNNLAINLDVLAAQDTLLNSQLQLTGAEFDRTVFYLDLVRATGRLFEVAATAAAAPPATAPASQPTTLPAPRP